MKKIVMLLAKILLGFVSILIFPIGCFVLGWYGRRYWEERKMKKEVKVEVPITSNTEDEKDEEEGVVV